MALTWLAQVLVEVANVTEEELRTIESSAEIKSNDLIIGILDTDLRKLIFIIAKRSRRLDAITPQCYKKGKLQLPKEDPYKNERIKIALETESLQSMFEIECMELFPNMMTDRRIEITKGWIIVQQPLSNQIIEPPSISIRNTLH